MRSEEIRPTSASSIWSLLDGQKSVGDDQSVVCVHFKQRAVLTKIAKKITLKTFANRGTAPRAQTTKRTHTHAQKEAASCSLGTTRHQSMSLIVDQWVQGETGH